MATTRKKIIFLFTLAFILFISCNNSVFDNSYKFNNAGWNKDSIAIFLVNIENTNEGYDIFIKLKNTDSYQYSNLFLFTKIISPKGKIITDTIECVIADNNGKWYGNKQSELYYNKLNFRKNIAFPIKGVYTFEIEQAMRLINLLEIKEIGLSVENTK